MAAFMKLEIEAGCFPRFRHYQHSIGSIFSRFKDKAERKRLLSDISKVGETTEDLGLKVKDVEQSPIVVFGPVRTKCPPLSEFLVSSDPYRSTTHASTFKNGESFGTKSDDLSNGKVTNKQFTKPTYTSTPRPKAEKHSTAVLIQEGNTLSVDTPYVIVLLTNASDVEEACQSLNDEYPGFMKNISDIQNSNIIYYRVTGDEGFRSSSKRNGQVNREDSYKSEVVCMDHLGKEFDSLSNAIQHSFETKAVRILEILFKLLQPPQSMLEGTEMCVETSQDMNIQLYHEVLALLRKTKVEVCVSLPEKQTISTKLQFELARITNVTGCGLIFGRLTVMVASNASYDELRRLRATVDKTLSGHNYEDSVDIHRGQMIPGAGRCQECIEDGTSSHQIKPGQRIRATSEEVTLGTLGGFVIGTQTAHIPVTEEATSTVVKQEQRLFGLTCAHCVEDATLVDATIDQDNTLLIWNNTSPIVKDNCISIDIAAMSINEEVVQNNCQHHCLRDGDGNETRADILQDTNGLDSGQGVFMWVGSELREGVIASDQSFMENGNRESIIIYPRQQTPFSNEGDSGGIVFVCAETGAPITAISILVGKWSKPTVSENSENVNKTDQEQTYICSQSYSLKKNIEALETNSHWRFALPVPEFKEELILDDMNALCNESSDEPEILDGPLGAEGGPIIEGENDEVDVTNEGTDSPQDQTQASNDNEDHILDARQGRRQEYDENQEQIQFQTTDDNGASNKIPNLDTNEEDDLEVDGCIGLDASISKNDVVERTYTSRHVSVAMPTGYYFRKQTDCITVYA